MNNTFFEEDEVSEVVDIKSTPIRKFAEANIDVNALTGETVELSPLEKIKYAAEKFGLSLNEVDPNCKKCHGRGYTGIDVKTGVPIHCQCIIPKQMKRAIDEQFIPQNRKTRRLSEKMSKKNR